MWRKNKAEAECKLITELKKELEETKYREERFFKKYNKLFYENKDLKAKVFELEETILHRSWMPTEKDLKLASDNISKKINEFPIFIDKKIDEIENAGYKIEKVFIVGGKKRLIYNRNNIPSFWKNVVANKCYCHIKEDRNVMLLFWAFEWDWKVYTEYTEKYFQLEKEQIEVN